MTGRKKSVLCRRLFPPDSLSVRFGLEAEAFRGVRPFDPSTERWASINGRSRKTARASILPWLNAGPVRFCLPRAVFLDANDASSLWRREVITSPRANGLAPYFFFNLCRLCTGNLGPTQYCDWQQFSLRRSLCRQLRPEPLICATSGAHKVIDFLGHICAWLDFTLGGIHPCSQQFDESLPRARAETPDFHLPWAPLVGAALSFFLRDRESVLKPLVLRGSGEDFCPPLPCSC